MKKLTVISCLFVIVFFACNRGDNQSKKEASIMYESKPLANWMLRMHVDALAWKGAIELEKFSTEFPLDYHGIYTVEATDSNVRTDVFIEKAANYIESVEEMCAANKPKKQVKKFNLMISSCVDCHEIFCQGPIDKIEKLYIQEQL